MKITSPFKDFTTPEYYLFGLFVLYLVIPFQTPKIIHNVLTNPVGLILLLSTATAMIFLTPPILAILFVLVIYELIRRDGSDDNSYRARAPVSDNKVQSYKYVSDNVKNDSVNHRGEILDRPTEHHDPAPEVKHESVYLSVGDSLEELVVSQMAPVVYAATASASDFRPVSENNLGGAAF
jgi:hypothetical protein